MQDSGAEIHTLVFLQNATLAEKQAKAGPFAEKYQDLYARTPLFTGQETARMAAFITRCFGEGLTPCEGLAQRIYSSPVRYSEEYQSLLGNLFGSREQLLSLLDDEQIALFDEIAREVREGTEPCVFLVHGKRGTGKTFVAVALLSYLYQGGRNSGLQVRYLEKNRNPRKMVETVFRVPPQATCAFPKDVPDGCDCLICDESHRFWEYTYRETRELFLDCFLRKCRVAVFFYDESQRVNLLDYVSPETIRNAMEKRGLDQSLLRERRLTWQHRCRDGDRFLAAVDRLLDHPELGLEGLGTFCENDPYQVALVDDPRVLFRLIDRKHTSGEPGRTSRVLAGKGRSYGRDWAWDENNTAYRGQETIAPLRASDKALFTWNFGNYGTEKLFATDRDSAGLVGCIDTSQGLDFEYVGVIIAPDLIYDPQLGQIRVNVDGHQRSDPNVRRRRDIPVEDTPEVRRVILNTYRVLLSRGERGCFIYCCDKNLHQYLSRIIAAPRVPESASPPAEPERLTGLVQYVAPGGAYAYISCGDCQYAVSEAEVRRTPAAKALLVNGKRVSFRPRVSGSGKRYAGDLRPAEELPLGPCGDGPPPV